MEVVFVVMVVVEKEDVYGGGVGGCDVCSLFVLLGGGA